MGQTGSAFKKAPKNLDIVIVGAGFAGLYMLYRARKLGLSVRVFEAGSGIGGTWFWNRYPGARCDALSMEYSYQFSEELQQEWTWSERFATQGEILKYIEHVADRFNLRPDVQLNTRVERMIFDEASSRWNVETSQGEKISARYCVMATGCLSAQNIPKFKGKDTFKGESYHSGDWPMTPIDLSTKRVAVIGTGSTGVQMIPLLAQQAKQLLVFQRTPAYAVPARNGPMPAETVKMIKADYPAWRRRNAKTLFGTSLQVNEVKAMDVSEDERLKEYERRWTLGGGEFFVAFSDLLTDERANLTASDFIRSKIKQTVKDPKTAELLTPKQIFGCKRVCLDTGYWETFNRPNVQLVDVSENPIDEITAKGIVTGGKTYEVDVIVYATGFDAMTGALERIDIRGRNGLPLKEKWSEGPKNYLGLQVVGFPNMFTITGPGSPSTLTTMVPSIEQHVNWIDQCIRYLENHQIESIEPTTQAEQKWVAHVNSLVEGTLLIQCNSWYVGANIPGKPRVFTPHLGFSTYVAKCEDVVRKNYEGFLLTPKKAARNSA